MFDEVISVRKGQNVINKGPGAYVTVNGSQRPIITTMGRVYQSNGRIFMHLSPPFHK